MRRERALDVAGAVAVALLKLAASIAIVELAGFRQISDDDYARTVIAQGFAKLPRFDPSGTSWLPFPFWMTGTGMIVFGRSLEVARGLAFAASAGATAAFFVMLRAARVSRGVAVASSLIASLGAWNLWLGAAPVPEGFTGPLMAIGALALVVDDAAVQREAMIAGASALLLATLSRYEAWPLAAWFAITVALRAMTRTSMPRARAVALVAIATLGPLAWMMWNARAHGSALHFLDRVARYRQATGAAGAPLSEKLAVYPSAWLRAFPDATVLLSMGAFAIAHSPQRLRPLALAMLAILVFLMVGEVGEGAPTHHPERALVGLAWIASALAAFAIDAARASSTRGWFRAAAFGAALAALVFVLRIPLTLDGYPGQGEADRRAQVERGRSLRDEGAPALTVVPCAYEHFALIAAYGAPERAVVMTAPEKRPVTETCPQVEIRR